MRKTAIEKQMDAVEAARERQAVEPEAMYSYIDVKGVRFYRPTVAHSWVLTDLSVKFGKLSGIDGQLVTAYVLMHDSQEVLNRISREVRTKHQELPEIALRYRERIFAVHLHDNCGTMDAHLLPGEGGVPWPELMAALAQTPYELPLTLEVTRQGQSEERFLADAWDAAQRLTALIAGGPAG